MPDFNEIIAGRGKVVIRADDSELVKGLNNSAKRLREFGEQMRGTGLGIAGAGLSLFGPIAGASAAFAEHGEALGKASKQTGVGVEQLSALQYAAQQVGVDTDALTNAFAKMGRVFTQGEQGSKKAAQSLGMIHLSAAQLMGLSPEQRFTTIADAISKIPDPSNRAAAAMSIFGKSGAELLPLLNEGSAGIKQLTDRFDLLGLGWSSEEAEKAAQYSRALKNMWDVMRRLTEVVGSAVAPAFTKFANILAIAGKPIMELIRDNGKLVTEIAIISGIVVGLGAALVVIGTGIVFVSSVVTEIAGAFSLILTPVTLLIAGIASIAAGLTIAFAPQVMAAFAAGALQVGKVFAELGRIVSVALGGASTFREAWRIATGEVAIDMKEQFNSVIEHFVNGLSHLPAKVLKYLGLDVAIESHDVKTDNAALEIQRFMLENGGFNADGSVKSPAQLEKEGRDSTGKLKGGNSMLDHLNSLQAQLEGNLNDLGSPEGAVGRVYGTFSTQGSQQLAGGGKDDAGKTAKNTDDINKTLRRLSDFILGNPGALTLSFAP